MTPARLLLIPVARCLRCREEFCMLPAAGGLCLRCDAAVRR